MYERIRFAPDWWHARRIGRIADACMKCAGRGIDIGAERQLWPYQIILWQDDC